MRTARLLGAVVTTIMLVAVAGCSSDEEPAAAPSVRDTAAPPPAAPPADACYALPFNAVLRPTNDAEPVPCTGRHTTRTLYVGRIDPVVDGHLLAIDSDRVQKQVADTCRARTARHLGGSAEDQRLARLQGAWFSPTLSQGEAGALWFRCDLVLLAGPDSLAPLPLRTAGLLATDNALDRFGTCGSTSPANPRFKRVTCSRPHTWRARATIDLAPGARYLGKAAGKAADARCRDIDARIAADNLRLRWSFEWPTKDQWDHGQRYGYCWTPDPA